MKSSETERCSGITKWYDMITHFYPQSFLFSESNQALEEAEQRKR